MPVIPRVSVIVPVFNVADHVGACLRSIAGQSMARFEVIVVDDGSTDGSGEIARRAVGHDPRFAFVHQANAGLSAARNAGLDRALAPYIAFVDSDDRIAPTYLQRLLETIEQSGADWVSCGITFVEPGKPWVAHSGLHDRFAWQITPGAPPERHDFSDWREVVRHFPSAWNKLYRRERLADLRFDAGMLYEDHAFFWRYALGTDHLLRLPEPLYLSTQGRDGQITRDGSDAVFRQFEVLDTLETLSAQSTKTGRDAALDRIASRLIFERAEAVTDRARWERFVQTGRAWMAQRGRALDRSLGVPPWWGDVWHGQVSVSVIVPSDGQAAPLEATLDSLAAQRCRSFEALVVPDSTHPQARDVALAQAARYPFVSVLSAAAGVSAARSRGLAAARGRAVVFLDAGDRLGPRGLTSWHTRLLDAGAQMGFAPMEMATGTHGGLHDPDAFDREVLTAPLGFKAKPEHALTIHGHPSAKIFDRAFLLWATPELPEGALATTHLLARVCALATRLVRLSAPVQIGTAPQTRQIWNDAPPAETLAAALRQMQADRRLATLPKGWSTRLWARLVWEKLNHAGYGEAEAAFAAAVRQLSADGFAQEMVLGPAGLDPYVGPRVQRMIGLPEPAPEAQA